MQFSDWMRRTQRDLSLLVYSSMLRCEKKNMDLYAQKEYSNGYMMIYKMAFEIVG